MSTTEPSITGCERQLREACAQLRLQLRAGQAGCAEEWFARFPDLGQSVEPAVELIYTEFTTREELGQKPTREDFYARFPLWQEDLRLQFEIHSLLTADTIASIGGSSAETTPPSSGKPSARWIGSYELLEEIARGTMGVVYRARHRSLSRSVALKMILAGSYASQEEQGRFRTEAEAAARLHHPNIVQIYEVGEAEGHPFLALEFVGKGSLATLLGGQPQVPRQAAQLIEVVARAIDYAHRRGIVHRDLKPANILMQDDRQLPLAERRLEKPEPPGQSALFNLRSAIPKVADFGLAKVLDQTDSQTKTGAVCGTPSYMAPEQASGASRTIGPAADIYALGAILYEMLTGRPPFRADNVLNTLRLVSTEDPVAPDRLQPGVPRDLVTICLKCLEKEPARRYATAEDMADDLHRFLGGEPIRARPTATWERAWKWAKRRPSTAVLLALLVLAGLTLVSGSLWYSARLQTAVDAAREQRQEAKQAAGEAQQQRSEALRQAQIARTQEEETKRQARIVQEQFETLRRTLYTNQLRLVEEVWRLDPDRALGLLEDPRLCPADLRDFSWRLYHHMCRRERLLNNTYPGPIRLTAFSADGKTLLTVGRNDAGTSRLWNVGTCEERLGWPNYIKVSAIAYSPNRQLLALAQERTIRLRDLLNEKDDVVGGLTASVTALAFAPNSGLLAIGGRDGSTTLLDLATRKTITSWRGHAHEIWALAFSANGKSLATAGRDRFVRVWDVASRDERGQLGPEELGLVTCLAFSADGKKLAVTSALKDGIDVWDMETLSRQDQTVHAPDTVTTLAFSADGKLLAAGCEDHAVRLWNSETGAERGTFTGHARPIRSLTFAPDGQRLVSAGDDGRVRFWLVSGRAGLDPGLDLKNKPVGAVFASDGRAIISTAENGLVKVSDAETLDDLDPLPELIVPTCCVALAPDDRTLATGHADGSVRFLDIVHRTRGRKLAAHKLKVSALAFSPDGTTFATASDDGTARLWDTHTGKPIAELKPAQGPVPCIAFRRDGQVVITGTADGSIQFWDARTGMLRHEFKGHGERVLALALSPDGTLLASGSLDGTVRLWHAQSLERSYVLPSHVGYVASLSLSFSPDGETLAVGSATRLGSKVPSEVRLWNVATGQWRARLTGQNGPVAFSPDGQTLATVSDVTSLKLCHVGDNKSKP